MYMHHSGQFFDTDNIGTKVLITTNETIFLDVQFYVSAYLLTYFSNVIKKSKILFLCRLVYNPYFFQVLHDLPLPITVLNNENNVTNKQSCCPEMNHKSDSFLLDNFDVQFHKEFGCVLPFFTNVKNQSLMCDLGGLSKRERMEFYNAYNGKSTTFEVVFEVASFFLIPEKK